MRDGEWRVLTVDIGNSSTKVALHEGERIIASSTFAYPDPDSIFRMGEDHDVEGVVYSCVGKDAGGIAGKLCERWGDRFVELTSDLPLPITVDYTGRSTLGADRVAAAVGVMEEGKSTLVIDAGTAVTSDLVEGFVFRGGNISPGLNLRFRALHDFTARLPLVEAEGSLPVIGYDTPTAIRAGVVGGLVEEIGGLYDRLRARIPSLRLLLTGGDAPLLKHLLEARHLTTEMDSGLVGRGLIRIFRYNMNIRGVSLRDNNR